MRKISAIIAAGGMGTRFDSKVKKQFFNINDKPILYYTFLRLNAAYPFTEYVVGANPSDFDFIRNIAKNAKIDNLKLAQNGSERAITVLNALKKASEDHILIHDAVRPFVPNEVVKDVIEEGFTHGGAICGLFAKETIKFVTNGKIDKTINRQHIFIAHTPQVFHRETLIESMESALAQGAILTDEASAYELSRLPVKITKSTSDNIKITSKEDMIFANNLMERYF